MPVKFESLDPETKRRLAEMIGQAEPPRKRRRDRKRRRQRVVVIHRVVKTPKATKVVSGLAVKKAKEPKTPSPEEAISPGSPHTEPPPEAKPHEGAPGPGPALAFFAVAVLILLIVAIGYTFGVRLASGGQPSQAVSAVAPKEAPKPSEPEQTPQKKEAQPAPARPEQPSQAPVEQVQPAPKQPESPPAQQSPAPAAVDWGALEKRLAKYVYRITSPTGKAGTAFEAIATKAGAPRTITAYHVVEGIPLACYQGPWRKPCIVEAIIDGKRITGEQTQAEVYPENDIAVLIPGGFEISKLADLLGGRNAMEAYYRNAPPLVGVGDLRVGEQVLIMGNPLDMWHAGKSGPVAVIGRIAAIGIPFNPRGTPNVKWGLKIEVPVSPGNSGSPVFNSKGEIIGMVIAGGDVEVNPQTNVKHFTAYVVPMEPLEEKYPLVPTIKG